MSDLATLKEEVNTLRRQNYLLEKQNKKLEKDNKKLEQNVQMQNEVIPRLEARVQHLIEELMLALHRQFCKTSEKFVGQDDLPFEDLLPQESTESVQNESEEQQVRRKKAGRKPLAESLPRVDHYHDLSLEEKHCACGHDLRQIGEDISEKLTMVPARVWVERHHYFKYTCPHCQGLSDESKPAVRTAKHEAELFPRSIVTPELLAHIWTAKFCDHLPYYRQEVGFARIGAEISRQDMVNWTLKISERLSPLIELVNRHILSGEVINMDETPVKVLELEKKSTESKGYMWLARGGPPGRKAVRYRFEPGRAHQYAKSFLEGYSSYLQTDGYEAYGTAIKNTTIRHVGCWAHARRKFVDANKVASSEINKDAIGRIRKLYSLEDQARDEAKKKHLSPEEFVVRRRELIEKLLAEFRIWLEQKSAMALPSGHTTKAISYTLGQWDKLVKFLEHAELTPDNNVAENCIRPYVLGRKNWLFHGNEKAAEASCRIYTLIETAKANGLEPYEYLKKLLNALPAVESEKNWDSLLPWNLSPLGKN